MDKWQALYTLLEAFGNSPTIMNGNATRFSQILSLDFDQAGQVASASIQVRGHSGWRETGHLVSCPGNQALSCVPFSWDSTPTKRTLALGLACSAQPFPILFPVPAALGGAQLSCLPKPRPVLRGFSQVGFTRERRACQ